ncbi:uncharacterized protein LOC133743793 [Rosa rugosa]|uniref:uncharacterized protein LOC133743793 n=1 Tax=Rosa rugosa TaxID=74645 RepID=UPI002B4023CD|nr:uncharacterized protein LOC133743793 [Rosa rugosa]
MYKPTYKYFTVEFSKDDICKDLNKVWKKEVESVFASYGLSCRMNEDECKMILETGNTEDEDIIKRARRVLGVLACGLSTQWVKPILLGQIYCNAIRIEKPDGMSEEEFSSYFDDFIEKFENLYELPRKWCCFVLYFEKCITVLATSFQATMAVRSLVQGSLFGDIPFQDSVEMVIRGIEMSEEEESLTKNLELFRSLLATQ